jgi:hypothetical protein
MYIMVSPTLKKPLEAGTYIENIIVATQTSDVETAAKASRAVVDAEVRGTISITLSRGFYLLFDAESFLMFAVSQMLRRWRR